MVIATRAPAFLTVQDSGFQHSRSHGIPPCGAMDRDSWLRGNLLVGNTSGEASLEWALSGGSLRFTHDTQIALSGARPVATISGTPVPAETRLTVPANSELVIAGLEAGRFLYIAIRGGVDVPLVLGSRATYLPGSFGGFFGRRIRTGDSLPVGKPAESENSVEISFPAHPLRPSPQVTNEIRVVDGPEASLFGNKARQEFFQSEFLVSATSDRAGYRLEGPVITSAEAGRIVSVPGCPGAIQIPSSGAPIVLMADGPTIGGYPRIAVVVSADLGAFAQLSPGDRVRFRLTGLEEAARLTVRGVAPA